MNRQKLILSVLLVLLVIVSIYSYLRLPRQKTVERLTYTSGAPSQGRKAGTPAIGVDDKKLHLELLDREQPRFSGFRRNIFMPIFHEEVKALPPPPPAPPGRPVLPPPPPAPPVTAPPATIAEPTPVQKDMAKFTFLGFLKKDNKKTIFLSSNNEIFLVKKGDLITGKYEVANITDDALTISLLAEGGEIVIPLVENKTLSAPRK
ncbi:MAG: hypothetical protein FD174_3048 [Geobacteraceae bacterium]|nr:MAG: hypothetical protein FD174_3048 [Geobacteraceae bacterium]